MEITNELKHCCCFLLLVYVKYQNRFKNYKERRYNTAHYFTVCGRRFFTFDRYWLWINFWQSICHLWLGSLECNKTRSYDEWQFYCSQSEIIFSPLKVGFCVSFIIKVTFNYLHKFQNIIKKSMWGNLYGKIIPLHFLHISWGMFS